MSRYPLSAGRCIIPKILNPLPAGLGRALWNFFKIFLINLALLGIGIVFIELVFGNWFSTRSMSRLNLIRNTTVSYDISHLYSYPSRTALYRRDKFGLRGEYKSPASIDILTVGGSTTDERYVPEGKTWQDVMHQDFLAGGKWVSVVNAGVDGQSTYGHLKSFEWWFPKIPDLKVKYFLFYVGINDFYKDSGYGYDDLVAAQAPIRQVLRERSALAYLWYTLKGNYQAAVEEAGSHAVDFKKIKWTSTPNVRDYETLTRERLDHYEERLLLLAAKTREWGAVPIFVTQNFQKYRKHGGKLEGISETKEYNGTSVNGLDIYFIMNRLNQRTMKVCRETGGICIDLAGELALQHQDFYDFSHTLPKGSAKIGHYLYEKLKGYF